MSETRRLLLEFKTELVSSRAKRDSRIREELIKAISDVSEVIRERALIAAIDLDDPTIVEHIIKSMDDPDDDVRIAAAQALAWYRQPRTVPVLLKGLKDPNPWVRSHCAAGLSKLMSGPIWARLSEDAVANLVAGFPDWTDEEITQFMERIGVNPKAIANYLEWRSKGFDVEIDMSVIEEMESGPIILAGAEEEARPSLSSQLGVPMSSEVEAILSELPREVLEKLPPEDLARLTPKTARELVDSLTAPSAPTPPERPGKKKVKVRRVRRVRKVKKGPTREELIAQLPPEVREAIPEEKLDELGVEELQALIAAPPPVGGTGVEAAGVPEDEMVPEAEAKPVKRKRKKKTKAKSAAKTPEEEKKRLLTEKFGADKAEILVKVPDELLGDIPEEQIKQMDVDTLSDLVRALGVE